MSACCCVIGGCCLTNQWWSGQDEFQFGVRGALIPAKEWLYLRPKASHDHAVSPRGGGIRSQSQIPCIGVVRVHSGMCWGRYHGAGRAIGKPPPSWMCGAFTAT
jgi:hypothetical protein